MSWVKHDDAFSQNRKVFGLSDKAYRLHFCGLEHCARNLTDGTIIDLELPAVAAVARIKAPKRYVDELLDAELWQRTNGHYEINGYLEYNPSAEQAKEDREKARERKRRWREQNAGQKP